MEKTSSGEKRQAIWEQLRERWRQQEDPPLDLWGMASALRQNMHQGMRVSKEDIEALEAISKGSPHIISEAQSASLIETIDLRAWKILMPGRRSWARALGMAGALGEDPSRAFETACDLAAKAVTSKHPLLRTGQGDFLPAAQALIDQSKEGLCAMMISEALRFGEQLAEVDESLSHLGGQSGLEMMIRQLKARREKPWNESAQQGKDKERACEALAQKAALELLAPEAIKATKGARL